MLSALGAVPAAAHAVGPNQRGEGKARFDVLDRATAKRPAAERSHAAAALRRRLGFQALLQLDPLTTTPRVLARLDGFLTGRSSADPADVALDYVAAHTSLFGLSEVDIAALELVRRYRSPDGVTHLVWAQSHDGIPLLDNDLRANVTDDGRLLNVMGSPRASTRPPTTEPGIGPADALARAFGDNRIAFRPQQDGRSRGAERVTRFRGGHSASLVLWGDGRGLRLAWRVNANVSSSQRYEYVIDAASGRLLRRVNRVEFAGADAWDYYPGAPNGGTATARNFDAWLDGSGNLQGPFTHVFADMNDNNLADAGEDIALATDVQAFHAQNNVPSGNCPNGDPPCSWNGTSNATNGWPRNLGQNSAQVFYFVNNFHDHLLDPKIAFSPASGNFENADPVVAQSFDGANGPGGLPDENHIDNANMSTPADGQSPTMQMYLFGDFGFVFANGGDDASIIYHEYTHGLSNRLVTDSSGTGALNGQQSGAMGEAWSDWYAMDYLEQQGFEPDSAADGEMKVGRYVDHESNLIRSQGLDCPVGSADPACPGPGLFGTAGPGGYTYGDYGRVTNGPEVHADGEIWAETLWDLRDSVGIDRARELVTGAMRLSPPNPSFLDMRNAILQEDTATGGADQAAIWAVFANRGMGFFASTTDASDNNPVADDSLPPNPGDPTGTVSGTVRDFDTTSPVASARVAFGGHDSGLGPELSTTSNSAGAYSIANVPPGVYPTLLVSAPGGFERGFSQNVAVNANATTTRDLSVRRDWAALEGGAARNAFTGNDYTSFGCGPDSALDLSLATGWGSDAPAGASPGAKLLTVRLPEAVDISSFAVDPGATCGDDDTASVGQFKIETSVDGASFVQAAAGTFTGANNHKLNPVTPASTARLRVRFVRFTMVAPQNSAGSGAQFMDMSELEVYGSPSAAAAAAPPPPAAPPPAGGTPPPPTAADTGPFTFKASVPRRRSIDTVLAAGLRASFSCSAACTVRGELRIDAKTARKLGIKTSRSVLIGKGSKKLTAKGSSTIVLKLTSKAKRALKRAKGLTVTVKLRAAPATGRAITVTRKVTLKR